MPNLSSAALEIEEFAKSARKLAKYAKQVRIDNTGFESNCTLSKIYTPAPLKLVSDTIHIWFYIWN